MNWVAKVRVVKSSTKAGGSGSGSCRRFLKTSHSIPDSETSWPGMRSYVPIKKKISDSSLRCSANRSVGTWRAYCCFHLGEMVIPANGS